MLLQSKLKRMYFTEQMITYCYKKYIYSNYKYVFTRSKIPDLMESLKQSPNLAFPSLKRHLSRDKINLSNPLSNLTVSSSLLTDKLTSVNQLINQGLIKEPILRGIPPTATTTNTTNTSSSTCTDDNHTLVTQSV